MPAGPAKPGRTAPAVWTSLAAVALVLALAGVAAVAGPLGDSPPTATSREVAVRGLVLDEQELRERPTRGRAWEALLATAEDDLGDVDLEDQDNTNAARTLAAAVVHARTGEPELRDRVVEQLAQVPDASLDDARVLSVARQVGGYAIAADLVGYRDADFVEFLDELRTRDLGNHGRWTSLEQTSEDTANNWGTWALTSRIAISRYLDDEQDVERAADVFRGFLGDRSAYAAFRPTDAFDESWVCGDPEQWVPVNPAGCGDRSGAAVEDISRSREPYPAVDRRGLQYTWEVLASTTVTALLLEAAGYDDVWEWSDRALWRMADFVDRQDDFPSRYASTQYVAWVYNAKYDEDLATEPAGYGRMFGFTDWLL